MNTMSSKYYNDKNGLLRSRDHIISVDFVSEIANRLAKEHEKTLENMLNKCGFTKSFVLSHKNDFSIESFESDPKRRIYMYKNRPLFMEIDEDLMSVDVDGMYTCYKKFSYEMMWDDKED